MPCAIGVGAGTPKRGASGVELAVRRVRPSCVVLLSSSRSLAKALAREKELGKEVVPPQREQHYPRRPAPTSGPQLRKQTDTAPPHVNVLPQVVEVLKMLGCSQDILDTVKSKVDEKTKTQHKVPGEKERMLHVLKMKLTKAKAHLAHLQGIEKKEEEYCHARDQVPVQEKYLADIQTKHDVAFLELWMAL